MYFFFVLGKLYKGNMYCKDDGLKYVPKTNRFRIITKL
jgi:hypothetical protein